jgi:hypothetical protein
MNLVAIPGMLPCPEDLLSGFGPLKKNKHF